MSGTDLQREDGQCPRYILITQCLQNDFFLNRESHLRLPTGQVEGMLVGKNGPPLNVDSAGSRIRLGSGFPAHGPLGLFLDAVIGARARGEFCHGVLHVINIRDWHKPGPFYDSERALYGTHCEEGSWGASYLEGLEQYLDPAGAGKEEAHSAEGTYYTKGSVRIYHVLSDFLFDFKPHSESIPSHGRNHISKFHPSRLEHILDVIMLGSDDQVEKLGSILVSSERSRCECDPALHALARQAQENGTAPSDIYLAVIGVYTDIKVQILLGSLRARYDIPNLAVSDTLTASPTLERHLQALDFSHKVLGIQVIHGLNDLIRFLGGGNLIENEIELVAADCFADYVTFFQDKQNVLAYEREKLQEYLRLTQRRSERVYGRIERANHALIWSGGMFLLITIAAAALNLFDPERYDWRLPLVTGGLGVLQIVTTFFSRPMSDMQKNLINLATFRMILESHSLKTALARFHLTTPQLLREKVNPKDAARQVAALKAQFDVLDQLEKDYQVLKELGFGPGEQSRSGKKFKEPEAAKN